MKALSLYEAFLIEDANITDRFKENKTLVIDYDSIKNEYNKSIFETFQEEQFPIKLIYFINTEKNIDNEGNMIVIADKNNHALKKIMFDDKAFKMFERQIYQFFDEDK